MGRAPILADDGKALVVAMDHARTHGPIERLEDPGVTLEASIEGGADAIMTTFGWPSASTNSSRAASRP